jgi:hypothetical protein
MKKLIIILTAISILSACEKNEQKPSTETLEENAYRIKTMYFTYNSRGMEEYKTEFEYDSLWLTSAIDYEKIDNVWVEVYRNEIDYSGNSQSLTILANEQQAWVPTDKIEYQFSDNRLMELTYFYYYQEWMSDFRWSYSYSNGLISELLEQYYYEGAWVDGEKELYTYEGNKLVEVNDFFMSENVWEHATKRQFYYEGNKLDNYTWSFQYEENDWFAAYKTQLVYTNELVSEVRMYTRFDEDAEWESDSYISYTYDETGHLVEEIDEYGDVFVYEYEQGEGNVNDFILQYSEDLGKPTFKNTKHNSAFITFLKNKSCSVKKY